MSAMAFRIDATDNVATLLADAGPGPVALHGAGAGGPVELLEAIALGHKVALAPIAEGEAVRKFGVAIGVATRSIRAGEWVHLHNCRSAYDARSATLDLHSGAATDTVYE